MNYYALNNINNHLDTDLLVFFSSEAPRPPSPFINNNNTHQNNNNTHIAKNFDVATGGIASTVIINIVLCAILFILFSCCLRPCLPLFNLTKKRRLMRKVTQYENEIVGEVTTIINSSRRRRRGDESRVEVIVNDDENDENNRDENRDEKIDGEHFEKDVIDVKMLNSTVMINGGGAENDEFVEPRVSSSSSQLSVVIPRIQIPTASHSLSPLYENGQSDTIVEEQGENNGVDNEEEEDDDEIQPLSVGDRKSTVVSADQFKTLLHFYEINDEDNEQKTKKKKQTTVGDDDMTMATESSIDVASPVNDDNNSGSLVRNLGQKFKRFLIQSTPEFLHSWIQSCVHVIIFMRELLNYIGLVLVSFFSRKHNNDDMRMLCQQYSRDVAVYLLFQKHIILALTICTFMATVVLLPLHLTGREPVYNYHYEFGNYNLTQEDYPLLRTSISMVLYSPPKMFVHVMLCVMFVLVFAFFMHLFRVSDVVTREHFVEEQLYLNQNSSDPHAKKSKKKTKLVSRYSVRLYNLPSDFTSTSQFDRMVREELCPDLKVFRTILIFTVNERIKMQNKYKHYAEELERYVYLRRVKHKSSLTCFCSFKYGARYLDAVEYYKEKMEEMEQKMNEWDRNYALVQNDEYDKSDIEIQPAGYGFVVFERPRDAMECLSRYYKIGTVTKPIRSNSSSVQTPDSVLSPDSDILRNITFSVSTAYEPDDINWDNMLTFTGWSDKLRNWVIRIGIVFIFLFCTSPLAGLSGFQSVLNIPFISSSVSRIKEKTGNFGNVVFQYLPTLFMQLFAICMPYGLWFLSDFAKYRSKSRYRRKLMKLMYMYLVLTTLLMPSMLLTGLDAVVTYFKTESSIKRMFQNMFLPASGAFFINYILQCMLLKNFGDLIRAGNIMRYFWGIRKYPNITPKMQLKACELSMFYFEYEYPYMVSAVAIMLCYSVFSPVILLFGWGYFALKHLIDRYVIMYIYGHKEQGARGVLSFDFRAHRKQTDMIVRQMVMNLFIFVFAMTIFFGTRVHAMSGLLPHVIICALLLMVIFIVMLFEHIKSVSFLEFLKYQVARCFGYKFVKPVTTTVPFMSPSTPETETNIELDSPSTDPSTTLNITTTIKQLPEDPEESICDNPHFIHAYEPPLFYPSSGREKI